MRCRSEAQTGRYGRSDYRWVADWQSVQSGLITCWNIWIDKVKIVLQYYVGTRSLYIQEGRQDKGRKTVPPSRYSGTQSCPDASLSLDASSSMDASSSLDASSSPDASLF